MRIWIDLDNSPHAHFFAPLIGRLGAAGHEVVLTAVRFGQVEEIAQLHHLSYVVIGRRRTHRLLLTRGLAIVRRALQLALQIGLRGRPAIAVNHGSRSQVIAAWLLRIPVMAIYDYEFISPGVFARMATKILLPEAIPSSTLERQGLSMTKVVRYPGCKENVYLSDLTASPALFEELELDPARLILVLRPPAPWAHYHEHQSEVLFRAVVERLRAEGEAQVIVLARTAKQREELKHLYRVEGAPFRIPSKAVDALSLMAYSDAVLTGGGTMGREAAILVRPAYSFFAGKPGAVDTALEREGKLKILRSIAEIRDLRFEKLAPGSSVHRADARTADVILRHITDLAKVSRVRG